jgi:cytochrome d ubiquinol oxidase subunit II
MSLEAIWYAVVGICVIFYALLDGFDLGVGSLHLFARNDLQRRTFLNAIGPVWDGNEVWIVIVMGGIFAGFPNVYATVFSGFYTLMMFLIAGLMFRAAAIEFRSKAESRLWRSTWDVVFSGSSILVALTLGVLVGKLIEGIPLDAEQNYTGDLSDILTPYTILIGLTSGALFAMHGAIYLSMKTDGETQAVVKRWINPAILVFVLFFSASTLSTLIYMPHMTDRFGEHPILFLVPMAAVLAIVNIPIQVKKDNDGWAFISSCIAIALLLSLYAIGTFPIIVRSTMLPEVRNLTIYNSASSPKTLGILMTVVAIGVPLVLGYGFWVYRIFRGKVRLDHSSY